MIIVTLGNNTNIQHFEKFAFLYRDVINYCKLFEYKLDILYKYKLPKPQTTITNITMPNIKSIILDYAKISLELKHIAKAHRNLVVDMNIIYQKISKAKFDYQFSRNDMLLLNKINKLVN